MIQRTAALLILFAVLLAAPAVPAIQAQDDPARATLASLEQLDAYPLYTMTYVGAYELPKRAAVREGDRAQVPAWGCSLFAALADPASALYGRNFDWMYSPAVLLFTDPPDGYASVSMVDIAYLGFDTRAEATSILELPLEAREPLLYAPYLPFDGMNEYGLAVGMAAVPPGDMAADPAKDTLDSLMAIRLMLDRARTVDEAVQVLADYNINMGGGPPLHYLIADASGRAVLAEFYQGALHIFPNKQPWHQATNFLRASVESPEGQCWRYDRIRARLVETGGQLAASEALDLLESVSQGGDYPTQWSIVYSIGTGEITVAMGRDYERVHTLALPLAGD